MTRLLYQIDIEIDIDYCNPHCIESTILNFLFNIIYILPVLSINSDSSLI